MQLTKKLNGLFWSPQDGAVDVAEHAGDAPDVESDEALAVAPPGTAPPASSKPNKK